MKTFFQFLKEGEDNPIETEEIEDTEEESFYPDGVYMAVQLDEISVSRIKEYQEKYLKGCDIVEEDDLHCTLIYSAEEHVDEIIPGDYTYTGTFKEMNIFGQEQSLLVVEINSPELIARNKELTEMYGFVSDFDEYRPHITLCYNADDIVLNSLPPFDFALTFEKEYVEALDTDREYGDSDDEEEEYNDDEGTFIGQEMKKIKKED